MRALLVLLIQVLYLFQLFFHDSIKAEFLRGEGFELLYHRDEIFFVVDEEDFFAVQCFEVLRVFLIHFFLDVLSREVGSLCLSDDGGQLGLN